MKNSDEKSFDKAQWTFPLNGPANFPVQALLSRQMDEMRELTSLSSPEPGQQNSPRRKTAFRRMTTFGKSLFNSQTFRAQLPKPSRPARWVRRAIES